MKRLGWISILVWLAAAVCTPAPTAKAHLNAQITDEYRVYVPYIRDGNVTAIAGMVTQAGAPAEEGLEIRLYRQVQGLESGWFASTNTRADGSFRFGGLEPLGANESYTVVYYNFGDIAGRLNLWRTGVLQALAPGAQANLDPFDIADVELIAPVQGTVATLPATFTWTARPATPSDEYQLVMSGQVITDSIVVYDSGFLGYVSSYTIEALSGELTTGKDYLWHIRVDDGYGGWGISRDFRRITFQ